MLMGALSGKPLSILDELHAWAIHFKTRTVDFDPERICFLVSEQEWKDLVSQMKTLRYYIDVRDVAGAPIEKIEILGIEVRKR